MLSDARQVTCAAVGFCRAGWHPLVQLGACSCSNHQTYRTWVALGQRRLLPVIRPPVGCGHSRELGGRLQAQYRCGGDGRRCPGVISAQPACTAPCWHIAAPRRWRHGRGPDAHHEHKDVAGQLHWIRQCARCRCSHLVTARAQHDIPEARVSGNSRRPTAAACDGDRARHTIHARVYLHCPRPVRAGCHAVGSAGRRCQRWCRRW